MPDDNQKSQSGKTTSDRQNEEIEIDDGYEIEGELDSEMDVEEEDRGVVSDDERSDQMSPEREEELGNRVTRDDGDNDDEGELK